MVQQFVKLPDQDKILLPRTIGVVVRISVFYLLLTAFLVGTLWHAISYISELKIDVAWFCCLTWVVLVTLFVIAGAIGAGGIVRSIICIVGGLSTHQFVEIAFRGASSPALRYGYRMFGLDLCYNTIPIDRITLVNWSTGQASSLAGKDMDDWHVAIWYRPLPPEKVEIPFGRRPEDNLFIIDLSGPKALISNFGLALVALFTTAGVPLGKGEDDDSFINSDFEMSNGNEVDNAETLIQ